MPMIPACPQCGLENTYPDGENYICPDCAHEWPMQVAAAQDDDGLVVKDANGNLLADERCGSIDQRPEGKRFIDHAENGHQGEKYCAWLVVIMKWTARWMVVALCSKPVICAKLDGQAI